MKSLSDLSVATLAWRKGEAPPPDFELRGNGPAGDGLFATLAFLDEEHTLARVETAEGTWTLKHLGLLVPAVTLREEGSRTNLAVFRPHALRHGKLTFLDGAVFDWAWRHEGTAGGAFLDPGGRPLVHLQAHAGRNLEPPTGLERCEVDLDPSSPAHYRHALLAAFGWFLLLFDHQKMLEEAAAATALRM